MERGALEIVSVVATVMFIEVADRGRRHLVEAGGQNLNDINAVRALIVREAEGNYDPLEAQIFRRVWQTASKPALVDASDGLQYVAKGSQNARMLFSEYVCGRLGHLISAPTVKLRFLAVTALRQREPQMAHFGTGLALGSDFVVDASDRIDGIQHFDQGDNRRRFAGLALLYAWARGGDCQFIYQKTPPQLVHSNDHGHFFPGQAGWTKAQLDADNDVSAHAHFASCAFDVAELNTFRAAILQVTDEDIRNIVKAPPQEWNVTREERDAMAAYLIRRRELVAALYPPQAAAA
jgi:hypothetical protein